jgi:hypothetical protein
MKGRKKMPPVIGFAMTGAGGRAAEAPVTLKAA